MTLSSQLQRTDKLAAMPTKQTIMGRVKRACQWILPGLLACMHLTAQAATSDAPLIATPALVALDEAGTTLDITTIDLTWHLTLQEKNLLDLSSEFEQALFDTPTFYDGQVTGDADSWARISHETTDSHSENGSAGRVTGYVHTHGQLYELQYREDMGGHALASLTRDQSLAEIPLPDMYPNPGMGMLDRAAGMTTRSARRNGPVAPRAIRIGIVIDSRYNDHHNGRGLAHALSIINGVDGLYQSQLGLALVVDRFRLYDDPATDPLREFQGDVEQLLGYYRDIRQTDDEMPAELGLVHLFSGLADPQKIIGLGWISTACRLDGYDLSMSTVFPYDMLLSAHEIAHNLGAMHDDDSACNSDSTITGSQVMWSELSGSTTSTFSYCSIDRMRSTLDAECVADNIDVGVAMTTRASDTAGQFEIMVSVVNQDSLRTAPQVISTTVFPAGTLLTNASAGCTITDTRLTCRHGELPADSQESLSVSARFTDQADPIVTASLSMSGFIDTEQLDNRAYLQLDLDNPAALDTLVSSSTVTEDAPSTAPASGTPPTSQTTTASLLHSGGGAGAGGFGPIGLLLAGLSNLLAALRRRMVQ